VLADALELLTYECDALPHLRESPRGRRAAFLGRRGAGNRPALRARRRAVRRARHGTGLSGGARPVAGGIVIALSRLNRVLHVDIPNQRMTVEPGVTNLEMTRQVAPFGYYYAPIRRASRCARSAATSRRTPAARTA